MAFRTDGLEQAGSAGDTVAALLTSAPRQAWLSVIHGRVVLENGELIGVDLRALAEQHRRHSQRMLQQAGLMR